MELRQLFESDPDDEHHAAMERTGFWGEQAAGGIFFAEDTRRFLLAHRSDQVLQPHTFGTWGGAINPDETPPDAAVREAREETGYHGTLKTMPLFVFKRDTFKYYNFLFVVPQEFRPARLNWENQGYRWCAFGDWPTPLHFGLTALFDDAASLDTMRRISATSG